MPEPQLLAHPKFDGLQLPLLTALLGEAPSQAHEDALRVLKVYSEGWSSSEVLEVHSRLAVPQISGRSILKLTPEDEWNSLRTEEERYQQLGPLKDLFAELRWSRRIMEPNSGELYSCSFWQAAQNQHPLAEMQSISSLEQQDQIQTALRRTAAAIFAHRRLDDAEPRRSFARVSQQVLGYRCDPIKGKIYRFAHQFLDISVKHPTFGWHEQIFPDPLYYVHHAKALELLEVYYGDAHGDLHPGNVFISMQADHDQICLIDAGLSEHRFPLFYDAAYLELSVLMRAELSRTEDAEHWVQLLDALSEEGHLAAQTAMAPKRLLPAYVPIYDQLQSIRSAFAEFLQDHRAQAQELRRQFQLMRICAALNFCNKPMPTAAQRKLAYLYAAFQLKAMISRGDDPAIAEIKQALKVNPDWLYQAERREQQAIESFWRKWSMPNWSQPIDLQKLLRDFEILSEPIRMAPSSLVELFVGRFIGLVWPNAYRQCQTVEERIAALGVLAQALQYQLYPLSVAYKPTYESYLDEIEAHERQGWSDATVRQALCFAEAVLEDAMFRANEALFERECAFIADLMLGLKPTEQVYWQHCLAHAQSRWLSLHSDSSALIASLADWTPETDLAPRPEWLIKKAMLMATCYSHRLDPALAVLEAGLRHLDLWPFQIQSQFLEAYLVLRGAFRIDYDSPLEDVIAETLRNKGFTGVVAWIKDWKQERPTTPDPPRDGQYQLTRYMQSPETSRALHAVKAMLLLSRSGHLPQIWNQDLLSSDAWEFVNDSLFQPYPQLCFYYTLQYISKNPIDAEWVRTQLKKHLLSRHSQHYAELKQSFYQQLLKVFALLQGRDSRLYMLILAVLSEFIGELPFAEWRELFVAVWQEFHQPDNLEILYSQTRQGPYLISSQALLRIEDPDLLREGLITLLKTDGEFDADYFVRPELIRQVIHNPEYEGLSLTPALEQAIVANIESLQDDEKQSYALIKLGLIDDKLSSEHLRAIDVQISRFPSLPSFSSRLLPILLRFSQGRSQDRTQARQHLHDLILAGTKRLWNTGIERQTDGHWVQHMMPDSVFPLHTLKRKATFPEGLNFSETEVWAIYESLKESLGEFNETPYAKPDRGWFFGGLSFSLLKEINHFLEDYGRILIQDSDYSEIKERIMAGIHEHAPSSGRPADLIATQPNTVNEGIERLTNLLRETDFDALSEYWNILLSKILLQAQPHLLTCLYVLSDWLVYFREQTFFRSPFFVQMYKQILERYQQGYPGEAPEYEQIECYMVDLALVLSFWGLSAPAIDYFVGLRQSSAFEEVRTRPDLSQRHVFQSPLLEDAQSIFNELLPENWRLQSVRIQGFKSFSSAVATTVEFNTVNLLIGANGSGKSSLLSLFTFTQVLSRLTLDSVKAILGDAEDFLFYGPQNTSEFSTSFVFYNQDLKLEYSFSCEINQPGTHLFLRNERIAWSFGDGNPETRELLEAHTESLLIARKQEPAVQALNICLAGIQTFHFQDSSPNSPLRQVASTQEDQRLTTNAGNLAAVLYRLRTRPETDQRYRALRSMIQRVFPQFDDFILEPDVEKQRISLRWSEIGAPGYTFKSHQASDGTLRFMALVTLLFQPPDKLPRVLILDEPELGLHPTALNLLAELLEYASQHCQLLVATQAGDLLNHFSADDVIVIDRTRLIDEQLRPQYTSQLSRKSESELAVWLEDYTLQELWDKNVLGGKP